MSNQSDYHRAAGKEQASDEPTQAHAVKVSTILLIIIPVGVIVALPAIIHAIAK